MKSSNSSRNLDISSTSDEIPSEKTPIEPTWPVAGRLAGVDYGTVRVGLAISDPSRNWVSPLETYQPRNNQLDIEYFTKLVQRESIVGWVVGLPIHGDGSESQKSMEARNFAAWLGKITQLPYRFMDERYSSAFAEQLLRPAELTKAKRKQRIDRIAAMIILESFIESKRRDSSVNADLRDH